MIDDDARCLLFLFRFVFRYLPPHNKSHTHTHTFAAQQIISRFPYSTRKKKKKLNNMVCFVNEMKRKMRRKKKIELHSSVATILIELIDWFNRSLSIVVIPQFAHYVQFY